MIVQYSNFHPSAKALLVEYHKSFDVVQIIPVSSRDSAKNLSWSFSVGCWRIKQQKLNH